MSTTLTRNKRRGNAARLRKERRAAQQRTHQLELEEARAERERQRQIRRQPKQARDGGIVIDLTDTPFFRGRPATMAQQVGVLGL